ncbi:ISL3 family transposase [Bacillus carboniphilus]|uniref:ISL3 family transposase n=1 Tax=Bacillus carboniphilus TaxID=86663 RepID=A0ABY9JU19_9BACI|nr:ISL3 family transposase [Bacillus carboniphilus]WLR42299.1 ISL3 family transposase [Bacillus carboniphilus]
MLSLSLGLPEFKVLNHEEQDHIIIAKVEKNTTGERCPFCGFMTSTVHDRRTRKVRDLTMLNKSLYLFIKVKRYRCHNCLEVFSETYESVYQGCHQTIRLREYLYQMYLDTTIQYVSQKHQIPYSTLERIFYSVAKEKEMEHQKQIDRERDTEDLVISLDEVSVKKGHTYETVLMDMKKGCILGMIHERTTESTKQLFDLKIASPDAVKTVVVDMWDPFHKAIKSAFPMATIVVDKYHVVQKVIQALDQVRKQYPQLKKERYTLLKGNEKLSEKQQAGLEWMVEEYPGLALAYYMKETFREFYQTSDYDVALDLLEEWIEYARASPLPSFHKVATTLKNWKAEILQYFLSPYTNGRTEGTNHKIKNIKRRAYGYRKLERFRLRVFLECTGELYKEKAA